MADFFKEGMQKYREGDYEQAGEFFQQDIENDDQNPKTWNALGICFSKLGQYEEASTCFENALMIDPGNATYEKNLLNNKKHLENKTFTKPQKTTEKPKVKSEGFLDHLIFIIKSLFTDPHTFFRSIENDSWKEGYKYYIALAIFSAIIEGIIISLSAGVLGFIILSALGLILFLVSPFINAIILYIGIRIMGGKRGLQNSLNISLYSPFPTLLFGWIPIIGLIFVIISLYLEIVGVKTLEGFSTLRAIASIFLVAIGILGLFIIIAAVFSYLMLGAGFFATN